MEEIWKDIDGFEGYYQISNIGNVKSLHRIVHHSNGFKTVRERILKPTKAKGYCIVRVVKKHTNKYLTVHRLVAKSFIKNTGNKRCVNHKNGIKTDNRVENLEWCTYKENTSHAYKTGLHKGSSFGKFGRNHHASREILQFDIQGNFIKKYGGIRDAERLTGVFHQGIVKSANGKSKHAGGFIWKYV